MTDIHEILDVHSHSYFEEHEKNFQYIDRCWIPVSLYNNNMFYNSKWQTVKKWYSNKLFCKSLESKINIEMTRFFFRQI